jgi:AmmeMemoRadiSam system protein B
MKGLLVLAQKKSRQIQTIDLRNSGDTAGDKSRVVGYGAYVID